MIRKIAITLLTFAALATFAMLVIGYTRPALPGGELWEFIDGTTAPQFDFHTSRDSWPGRRHSLRAMLRTHWLELRFYSYRCDWCGRFDPNHDEGCIGEHISDGPIDWIPNLRPRVRLPGLHLAAGGWPMAGYTSLALSLWPLLVLFAAYPTWAFVHGPLRRHQRRRHGRCIQCGYNLTGNTSGVCPECGTRLAPHI